MEVRITFRSEIYIEGATLSEIKEKFEGTRLYNNTGRQGNDSLSFIEIDSVEEADSQADLLPEWKDE